MSPFDPLEESLFPTIPSLPKPLSEVVKSKMTDVFNVRYTVVFQDRNVRFQLMKY